MLKKIFKFPKVSFNRSQRKELSIALYNTANFIFAVIVLGQFVTNKDFDFTKLIFGFILWFILFIVSTLLNKE